mmetsp:Transcript_17840/g.55378  ORF Transcript_17840/g.55378 Transcript_17840/m.55378 type:complete len:500 (+) Transcript_17840:535-2034(+)
MTTMKSACGRNCTWCVTSTRVRPFITSPLMQPSKSARHTCGSTADSGSSITTMSRLLYTARARATRCFCPPDRLMPRSPMAVKSDAESCLRSSISCDAMTVSMYHSSSKVWPKVMFSRTVAFWIHASCGTKAMGPLCTTRDPSVTSASPTIAETSVDLPEAVGPMTMVSLPFGMLRDTSSRMRGRAGTSLTSDAPSLAKLFGGGPPSFASFLTFSASPSTVTSCSRTAASSLALSACLTNSLRSALSSTAWMRPREIFVSKSLPMDIGMNIMGMRITLIIASAGKTLSGVMAPSSKPKAMVKSAKVMICGSEFMMTANMMRYVYMRRSTSTSSSRASCTRELNEPSQFMNLQMRMPCSASLMKLTRRSIFFTCSPRSEYTWRMIMPCSGVVSTMRPTPIRPAQPMKNQMAMSAPTTRIGDTHRPWMNMASSSSFAVSDACAAIRLPLLPWFAGYLSAASNTMTVSACCIWAKPERVWCDAAARVTDMSMLQRPMAAAYT